MPRLVPQILEAALVHLRGRNGFWDVETVLRDLPPTLPDSPLFQPGRVSMSPRSLFPLPFPVLLLPPAALASAVTPAASCAAVAISCCSPAVAVSPAALPSANHNKQ